YQNKVIYPPYHLVSASVTRDASDLLDKQNIPYLKSVESMIDQHSEEYCHTFFYSWEEVNKKFDLEFTEGFEYKETLSEQIKIKKSSQKNYVASVEIGEFEVTGDRLRELFDLPSISFELFLSEEGMRIVTYGVGHGLGMSLYGAQQMAEKGMDYQTILKYFYPETEIKVLSE
ncbi:MAG: SpoIID/LytB domain-containing protein, partial [Clostridia bacterium]|nr:SpoIID/LytB domain-containing protein [Clostridia bacterium]